MNRTRKCFVLVLMVFLASVAGVWAAANVVVVRVGDGTAALSSAATPVFLQEYTPSGELARTITLPIAVSGNNSPVTLSGTATSEGALRRSADGRYLTLAGYAATPGTVGVSSSLSTTTNRVIARVDSAGTVDTSTLITSAFSGGNIRGAVSNDGSGFWAVGSNSGVQYVPFGSTGSSTVISSYPANIRVPGIFGGQLHVSSASSGYIGVGAVGSGLPATVGQYVTLLPGFPTTSGPSPYGFVGFDLKPDVPGIDTIYVADDRSTANGGGIQKWTFDGTVWTLEKALNSGLTPGCRGVTGYLDEANVVLFATTTANTLVTVTDDGSASPAFTTVATAPTNTVFRGVDLAPGSYYSLTIVTAGTGGDMVTITRDPPEGYPTVNCGVGTCQVVFPSNSALVLTPVPDVLSLSAAWDGSCAGSTVCNVTMDADKTFTATFSLAPVANISTNTPYTSLASAITAAQTSGAEIRMLNMPLGDGSAVILDKSILLSGGWQTYASKGAQATTLSGNLTVQGGNSTVEAVVVKGKLAVNGGCLRVKDVQVQP